MDASQLDPVIAAPDWLRGLDDHAPDGLDVLGSDHAAHYVDGNDVLLVAFSLWSPQAQAVAASPLPASLIAARAQGWSVLSLLARRADWFRAPVIAAYLEAQRMAEFFAGFQRVIFYGTGMGGYAACLFAAETPGAEVLALAPQATLDPAIAGWDDRFPRARRLDFGDVQGFAPDRLAQAKEATLVFDPAQKFDAMHAALFRGPNIQLLRAPGLGPKPEAALQALDLLAPLFAAMAQGALDQAALARLIRPVRRDKVGLLQRAQHCLQAGQPARALAFAQRAAQADAGPQAHALLAQIRAALLHSLP
jgi:hypothetical protein